MSEFGKYVPEEAKSFEVTKNETAPVGETGKSSIQGNVEDGGASGVPVPFETPDGNLVTPEKTELYHSPETTREKEPGFGPNPSFDHPPAGGGSDDQTSTQDTDDE